MMKRVCSHCLGLKFISSFLVLTLICCAVVECNSTFSLNSRKDVSSQNDNQQPERHGYAVKSIRSEDGDVIDCIDIYKQPAFDHPALRNHIIQMRPSDGPTVETNRAEPFEQHDEKSHTTTSQLWQKSGSCPEGTIPVRRIRENELNDYDDPIKDYGRKKLSLLQANRSKAILIAEGFGYLGVKGNVKVDNPYVESDDEYSTSRVALKSGPYNNFETIEFGWAVNPRVYGDRQTRLYVYWTVDASKTTGCFDITCPGFVQTSHEIALGAAIYPISMIQGLPYEIIVYIFQDVETGNWWVQYGGRTNIGYFPGTLFRAMAHRAEGAEWGGEVYSTKLERAPHTATAMGSGQFPDWATGTSGSVKRIRVLGNSGFLMFPDWVYHYADEYRCYDVFYVEDYIVDPEFYYGGPGRNDMCP